VPTYTRRRVTPHVRGTYRRHDVCSAARRRGLQSAARQAQADIHAQVDGGDFVIVINAKGRISGDKLQKSSPTATRVTPRAACASLVTKLEKHADRVVEKAIVGMAAHNKLSRQIQKS